MKTLDLSAVTPSVGIIPQKDTVEHITSSYLEGVASLAKSMIPTSWQTGKLVILHGCVATGSNPAPRTLTAGAVFYNGEVYQVPAASFTTTGLQIGIWTLQDVNTGTESKLTDGSDVHILVNNKFVFAAGLAGSGDFDEGEENSLLWLQDTLIESTPTCSVGTISGVRTRHRVANNMVDFNMVATVTITNATSANSYAPPRVTIENIIPYEKYKIKYINIDYQNILTGNGYCDSDIDNNQGFVYSRTLGTTTVSMLLVARYPTTLTNGDKIFFNVVGSYELA